ncbi:hypothetical protein NEUTE1DRAFT_112862 [Neurospora tetrasperma FGSC 2508]|uniref:Uncharacterized protein n=1 Tax=Neurospora tetrasperma (strain FGSC 2508 / ATCC MYA-4615 / P0657) TaxID=510951 RepID=F8MX76_NEUT8|nr:uncharacterized protein NEUTE1DRAFT_112862 [Neurospora tetrasperma FGSC 2508]EGO54347.1 hypothetical protein NEUTE1DRAFT_112862 [Neurospora tetrasperma FGSC 2508]
MSVAWVFSAPVTVLSCKHHVVPSTQQAKVKKQSNIHRETGYIQTIGILGTPSEILVITKRQASGDSSFMKTSKLTWDSYDLPRLQAKLPILHIHLGGYHHEVELVMRHVNAGFTMLQRLSNDYPSVPFNPRYSHHSEGRNEL